MHRIQGQNRLAGPAQGDHGFQGVFLGSDLGAGMWRAFERSFWHVVMGVFFALCRAEPGALKNSGADQVGRAGFGRRRGEAAAAAAARHGLQQHLRKLPVLPFVLLQGWVSEAIVCVFVKPISHLLPTRIDVVFEQSDDTDVLVCSVSGVLKSCGWIWKPQVCGLVSTSLVNLIQPADAWWTPTCRFGRYLIDKATESYFSVLALCQNWGFIVCCTVLHSEMNLLLNLNNRF